MIPTLTLIALAVVALTLLGHASQPRGKRVPLRSWTPVHVADLVGAGFKMLLASGQERYRRHEAVVENTEGRDPKGRSGEHPPDGPVDQAGEQDQRDDDEPGSPHR